MTRRIPAAKARRRFGTLLDEVRLRGDEVIIERDGKPAVMISLETYQELRGRAREEAFFQKLHDELAERISEDELERLSIATLSSASATVTVVGFGSKVRLVTLPGNDG